MYDRALVVQQAQVFVFEGDIERFIETGQMTRRKKIPYTPEQQALIDEIHRTGKLIIKPPQAKSTEPINVSGTGTS
ncbi:MAG: hypothetical protein L0211_26850 [Planctomycetaceae bacterium]|nr:hypothetical protein [Planctomycetaceae bacterium]